MRTRAFVAALAILFFAGCENSGNSNGGGTVRSDNVDTTVPR